MTNNSCSLPLLTCIVLRQSARLRSGWFLQASPSQTPTEVWPSCPADTPRSRTTQTWLHRAIQAWPLWATHVWCIDRGHWRLCDGRCTALPVVTVVHVPAAVFFASPLLSHCSDAFVCSPLRVSGPEPWRDMVSVGGSGLAHTLAHHSRCSTAMLHLSEVSRACWVSSLGGRTESVSALRSDGPCMPPSPPCTAALPA